MKTIQPSFSVPFPKHPSATDLKSAFLLLLLVSSLGGGIRVAAQPTIDSTVPANGATGVGTNSTVVFTFSDAMDTNATSVLFYYGAANFLNATTAWNSATNILTCTPVPGWPPNTTINWIVSGQDLGGNPVAGVPIGNFTTGSTGTGGGGGGGSGTNSITAFVVGKGWIYNQTSTNQPTLDPTIPYFFDGITSLASNRTATNITLGLPSGGVSNLFQNPLRHEDYILSYYTTNLTSFNATVPAGPYLFKVGATASNQQVTVNLPAFAQPNAPHITNYNAAQSINATQAFTLGWDAFTGGGSTDMISVAIGTTWQTPGLGQSNVLNGTARGVTIPANTLQAGSNYSGSIGFYHVVLTTNTGYITEAWVATTTQFTVTTSGAAPGPIIINEVWSAGKFGFDVVTIPSQMVTVVSSSNLNSLSTSWPVMLTTNSPGALFHVTDPRSTTNKTYFYRARNGP